MEWPNTDVVPDSYFEDPAGDLSREEYLANLTTTLVTKEIYARAARAAVSDILADHSKSGLEAKVEEFVEQLKDADDDWNTEYRNIARSFAELMAEWPLARTLEICRGGLEAVHDLLRYRLPEEEEATPAAASSPSEQRGGKRNRKHKPTTTTVGETILPARDAFVLCRSFSNQLRTRSVSGSRAPDLEYRFGLLTATPDSNDAYAGEGGGRGGGARHGFDETKNHHNPRHDDRMLSLLYGEEAYKHIAQLREVGQLENSAASLANHTLTNYELVASLEDKTFVIVGCDHPLAPTKSLLRIPGVTVLGVPSSKEGLDDLLEYIAYNAPDDTTFLYPDLGGEDSDDGTNLVLSKGPHVAQWILENTNTVLDDDEVDNHLSAYTKSNSGSELVLVPMPLPSPCVDRENPSDPSNAVSTRVRESAIRWAASSDLVLDRVLRARSDNVRCSVWSYQSSTTCMVVPASSTTKSTELLQQRPFHEPYLHKLSLGTILKPTIDDRVVDSTTDSPKSRWTNHDYAIVNGILTLEGPHHMLAEHIRLWRSIVTHFPDEYRDHNDDDSDTEGNDEDDDDLQNRRAVYVFAPHLPLSLASSSLPELVARGNAGLLDDPLQIFDAGAVASLLAAMAIAGLTDPIVNRPMPLVLTSGEEHTTPFAMFWYGSFHGGIWNCPYTLESVSGTLGYVLGKAYEYYHYYATANSDGAKSQIVEADATPASVVDAVPSTARPKEGEDLPDYVQERLEFVAGP